MATTRVGRAHGDPFGKVRQSPASGSLRLGGILSLSKIVVDGLDQPAFTGIADGTITGPESPPLRMPLFGIEKKAALEEIAGHRRSDIGNSYLPAPAGCFSRKTR